MATSATEGRDSPGCLTQSIANLASTVDIDPGVCIIVDLGALTPGDVFEIELVIQNVRQRFLVSVFQSPSVRDNQRSGCVDSQIECLASVCC